MIVLVTGATAGFGECITRRFIEQWAQSDRHWPSPGAAAGVERRAGRQSVYRPSGRAQPRRH